MTEHEVCEDPIERRGSKWKFWDSSCHDAQQSMATGGAEHFQRRVESHNDRRGVRSFRCEESHDSRSSAHVEYGPSGTEVDSSDQVLRWRGKYAGHGESIMGSRR